jgi:para-nitrobenzyl esterase
LLALYRHDTNASAQRANQDVFREHLFSWGAWASVRAHRRTARAPAWLYQVTHPQPFRADQSFLEGAPASTLGAFHSGEYPYLFGTLHLLDRPWTETDHALSRTMQAQWVAFAHNGDPNGAGLPRWIAFDEQLDSTLLIQPEATLAAVPDRNKLLLFDEWFRAEHARMRSTA